MCSGGGGGRRGATRLFVPPWRPWKGQGKVTGNQRVRKAQEFCIGLKYHALSNIKPFAFEGLRAGGEGFWSSQETCREGQGLWEMCVCVGTVPQTRAQVGAADLRFSGRCCPQSRD